MLYSVESEALKNSKWPRCDALAEALATHGPGATEALLDASKSRTHHVRSACLRALIKVAPDKGLERAKQLISDKAYEVRETAAKILGIPTPG